MDYGKMSSLIVVSVTHFSGTCNPLAPRGRSFLQYNQGSIYYY